MQALAWVWFPLKGPRINPFKLICPTFLAINVFISFFLGGENDCENRYKTCDAVPGIRRCPSDVSSKQKKTKEQIRGRKVFSIQRIEEIGERVWNQWSGEGGRRRPNSKSILPSSFQTRVALIARIPKDYR